MCSSSVTGSSPSASTRVSASRSPFACSSLAPQSVGLVNAGRSSSRVPWPSGWSWCRRARLVGHPRPKPTQLDIRGPGSRLLAEALAGARVVVDVANSSSFEDKAVWEFFETSGRNLLAAGAAAGVEHHVALSVVGTDRLLES